MSDKNYTAFDQEINQASSAFNLLSEPNRLSVLVILSYGACRVTDIYKCLTIRQNLISHHLKVLKDGGLIESKRKGREIFYSLKPQSLLHFKRQIDKLTKPLHT